MNTTLRLSKPSRMASLALAAVLVLSTLHGIDALASRDHGSTVMARAAGQVVALAAAVRSVNRG